MASVEETLEKITSKSKEPNRFSKKNFNELLKSVANDPNFAVTMAKTKGDSFEATEVLVTKGFRKFLKKVIEKVGVDKKESEIILGSDFTIDNVDGLYEFIAAVLYEYMAAGNYFEFIPREDFKGKITVKQKDKETRVRDIRNPQTKENMGTFEYTTKPHKILTASSPTPKYLTSRKKVK